MAMVVAVKFLHILIAVWFVAGLIGRSVTLRFASRERNVERIEGLLNASAFFERFSVIPGWSAVLMAGVLLAWLAGYPILGSLVGRGPNWVLAAIVIWLSTLPWVPLVFLPRGKVFGAALEDSRRIGQVASSLTTAFDDPLVRAGRLYEYLAVIALIFLMVAKPF
jgi:uncharacterized membrane protein